MDQSFLPQMMRHDTTRELTRCRALLAQSGLVLSEQHMLELSEQRFVSLRDTGRIEFGESALSRLIAAFAHSPFLMQHNFVETLSELQSLFYHFKNESYERLSDDELLDAMRRIFNGPAQGSTAYLGDMTTADLYRAANGIPRKTDEEDNDDQ